MQKVESIVVLQYMKKLIGLVMSVDADGKAWNNYNYARWISASIGNPVMIDPYETDINKDLDLLVLPGGSDINPLRYMPYWHPLAGLPNRALEYFDQVNLPKYINNSTPVFGICRGLQTLNVLFGGSLKPDIPEPTSYADGEFAHYVKYRNDFIESSSNHHQAIDRLGEGFEVVMEGYGKTYNDKNRPIPNPDSKLSIECIRHSAYPILATQFHPEKQHSGGKCKKLTAVVNNLIAELIN